MPTAPRTLALVAVLALASTLAVGAVPALATGQTAEDSDGLYGQDGMDGLDDLDGQDGLVGLDGQDGLVGLDSQDGLDDLDSQGDRNDLNGQDGRPGGALVDSCAAEPPLDHADPDGGTDDTVGWVDGYWYDEPVDVDASDGLDDGERDRLVARTAARVEALRCLAFEERPSVEVLPRSTYAEEIEADVADRAERVGDLKDAQYATMLLLGADQRWSDVRADVLAAGVGAYYDPDTEQITMIVEDADDAPVEHTLAHELVHALQDQQFDLHRFDANRQSPRDAELGVIEGDARLVQQQYQRRCQAGRWTAPCVEPRDRTLPDLDVDLGAVILFEQPYLYGPAFVDRVYRDGGWSAVDALYDELPAHSSRVVAEDRESAPNASLPAVEDRSTEAWERVSAQGRPDDVVVGQAALTSMFVAPAVEPGTNGTVISRTSLLDPQRGTASDFDQPETSGWRGDRMYAYTDGDRLATVWNLAWVDAEAAERFAAAYESLLEIRGGAAVDGREDVYVLDEATGFDAAVRVTVDGDSVAIVTAPTVEALTAVGGEARTSDSEGTPGFGVVGTVLAVLVAGLAIRWCR